MTQAQFTIPGGQKKGTPLADAEIGDIRYWEQRISKALEEGTSKYPPKDKAWVEGARAELARRNGGGAPAAAPRAAAPAHNAAPLARTSVSALAGTYRDPKLINAHLEQAAQNYNLVSPASAVGALPEGCGVALSLVTVDVESETYNIGGKRGLAKVALDKIGAAVGISWIPEYCQRVDDGSDPHYVHYKVAGYYRAFDGQKQLLVAEKQMDLRDGSPTCRELEAQAASKGRGSAENQIRQMRAFILEHAESKAKNRAIRSMGVRTSYQAEELKKPFVCARIMFTGQTNDPALKAQFATMTAEAFLGSAHTLYGQPQPSARSLPPAAHTAPTVHPPPPVGSLPAEADDYAADYDYDAHAESVSATAPAAAQAPVHEWTIPGGAERGVVLAKASDKALQYWAAAIGSDLDNGNARDPENDGRLHGALLDEIKRRESKGTQAELPT